MYNYYTSIYAYTQYTKFRFAQKIRPLQVFNDLWCQTSGKKTFLGYGDATMQTYAWLHKIYSSTKSGEIALWDFNQYSGTSFAGEIQTAPFYSPNILFSICINNFTQHNIDIYILIHYFAASVFSYIFPSLTPKKPQSQYTSRIPALFLLREMRNVAYMTLCQNGSLASGKHLSLCQSRAFMPGPKFHIRLITFLS